MTSRNAPSGPGRFSTRTDRGSASVGRADLTGTGRKYGEAKALNAQAAAAPVPTGGGAPAVPPSRGGSPDAGGGIFGPTARPTEPITAGVPQPMGPVQADQYIGRDTDMVIEQLAKIWPDPYIVGLMDR